MRSKKRKMMIIYDNEFLSELETLLKDNNMKFKIGKCDLSIDPTNIKKHEIKITFTLKKRFMNKIEEGLDEDQTEITRYTAMNKN